MSEDIRGFVIFLLLMLSASFVESRGIKANKNKGRGSDIDNPNVPKESGLENILESQKIFDKNNVKKPKHLHKFDKPWQKDETNDVHFTDSGEGSEDSGKINQKIKNGQKNVQQGRKEEIKDKRVTDSSGVSDGSVNIGQKRTFSAGVTLWPYKTVPYVVDDSTIGDLDKFMTTLDEAIALFSAETCIKWRVWNESMVEELGHSKYMTFQSNSGCSSTVGFHSGKITLSQPGCSSVNIFVHEMLHALGMNHEHVRLDRDQHLKVHWENIQDGVRFAFTVINSIDDDTLDPYSVLEYGLKAFSNNGAPTIEFKDKEYEFLTTLTRFFSFYDFKALSLQYQCHDICENLPECQNYGYVDHHCVCRCPTGLKGTYCEEREGNCGSYINLTSGEIQEIKSPGWPNAYNVDLNCVWLIHAPENHRIKVTITDMDLAWNKDEQRCYHWLEMHTNLIAEPGLVRCGELSDLSTASYFHSVNPEAGVLLLNFDSTFANDKTPTKGFRLEVEAFKSGCLSNPCLMGATCNEGNNDFTFTCSCVPGYSGPLCDQVEASSSVRCDMEWDFGDHCFLVFESYGWKEVDSHTLNGVTSYANQGKMFARPTTTTSELFSGVKFADGNRCLAFDYLNNGGNNQGGLSVYYETNNEITEILSTNTNEGPEWKTVHTNISTTEGFKLVFKGIRKYGRTTGIDNVIVAPGFCGAPCVLVNPCANEGVCVPSEDNLDFTCECTNGYSGTLCETPSANTIFRCDFEQDMPCFLVEDADNSAEWIIRGGNTPTFYTGPSFAKSGNFYSYINAATAQPNDTAVYKNQYQNLPATQRCLVFYYHMRGKDMGALNVKITDVNGLQTLLWRKSGDHPDEWFKAVIDIPSFEGLNVFIEGIVGASEKSDIGIDDVTLRPGICGCASSPCANSGSCVDDPDLLSYSCYCTNGYGGEHCELVDDVTQTCDLEISEDSCFLKQDSTDNFQWTRHQGSTGTAGTGPSSAVGTGQYYYYMESSNRNYQVARLYTTDRFTARDRCLKFYYHMYGLKMGSLEVKTNTKSLFLRRGDQLDQWHYAVVPVEPEQDLKLIFEGTVGPGWKSDIAIDDVVLDSNACGCEASPCKNGGSCVDINGVVSYNCHCTTGFSGPNCDIVGNAELRCTLEDNDGDCFLIQDQTERQNWIKHSGTTPTAGTGPQGAFGDGTYYYYMEATKIPGGDVAMLKTTSTFEDMERCLELNYVMYGSGMGSLTVKANGLTVFTKSSNLGQEWKTAMIEMPIPLYNITIEGVRGSLSASDIAIDDVILHPQHCGITKKRQLLLEKLLEELIE